MNTIYLGISKIDITPPIGDELQGYGEMESTGVIDPLFAKVLVLSRLRKTLVLVTCDLTGISSDLVAEIRKGITRRFPFIHPKDVMVSASHAHCAPVTMTTWHAYKGYDYKLFRVMNRKIIAAVAEAMADRQPVTVGFGLGKAAFNINRRLKTRDGVIMAPNPKGVCDREVQVVRFDTADRRIKAILFNYACHSTVMGGSLIHTDYPGEARRVIETALPGTESFFTLGACGDVRPMLNPPGSPTFGGGTIEAIARAGAILGNEVVRVAKKIKTHPGEVLKSASTLVKFPLEKPRTVAQMKQDLQDSLDIQEQMKKDQRPEVFVRQESINAHWARAMLKRAKNKTLVPWVMGEFQILQIGNLYLFGLPGEIFCEYGRAIKKNTKPNLAMVCSQTNDCINYFPTARALRGGGFETDCYKGFYLPARFSEKMEGVFLANLKALYRKLNPA